MSPESIPALLLVPILIVSCYAAAAPGSIEHLDTHRGQGVERTDMDRGRQLWHAKNGERSCTSCHGERPADPGRHARTGKAIEPMAPSVNPDRLRNARKIEKWFLRNCKWTFGRECSLQEKADILTWLAGQ
jgi:hypothetical protein